uniref:Ig-like domain-containing protein n=1 Tax=Cyclopterus lumpus TaxID=8103 RepID=A0A8C3A728_CYCLU
VFNLGQYLCTAQNSFGSDRMVITLAVQTEAPKIQAPKSTEIAVYFGKSVTLDCLASGKPPAQISWILPDRTFVRDYKCIASNAAGADTITYHLHVAALPPSISEGAMDTLGESAKLSCHATGQPTPKIMWISPRNYVISLSSDKFQVMDDGMLLVKKVILADEGKYACVARNSAGDDVKNIKLEAELQEPFINGMKGRSTTKVLAVSYQTALLDCRVEGKPEPRVWWVTPYGHSLPTPYLGGRFQVHRNGSLELRGVRKTDEGGYMCLAKNNLGEASLVVELDVASIAEKPIFAVPNIEILPIKQDGGELILECPARGKPNPEFAWVLPNGTMLKPGVRLQRFTHHLAKGTLHISHPVASDKGVYRCLAKNVAGQAEKRYALESGRKPVIRGSTGMFFHLKLIKQKSP